MPKLPRKHIRIAAVLVLFLGLFFGATAYLGAEFQLRSHGARYAIADLVDFLVDLFGHTGAAIIFAITGAISAFAILRFVPTSDD